MYCPKCGAPRAEYPFCTQCGAPFRVKRNKGRIWPPLVFMAVMLVIGTLVFLKHPDVPTVTTDPWFQENSGRLTFLEDAYQGTPELRVPEGISELDEFCFAGSEQLQSILLADSVTAIGPRAFANCGSLRGVKLGEGVTTIGKEAFLNCDALEAVTIPASIRTVAEDGFQGCDSLRHIFFEGTISQWKTLNIAIFGQKTTIYCTDGALTGSSAE